MNIFISRRRNRYAPPWCFLTAVYVLYSVWRIQHIAVELAELPNGGRAKLSQAFGPRFAKLLCNCRGKEKICQQGGGGTKFSN